MLELPFLKVRSVIPNVEKAAAIITLVVMTGCTNMIRAGSLVDVHQSFDDKKYHETLSHIRLAENLNDPDSRLVAELTYMKARSLEELDQLREANALYLYLKDQHASSPYASLAQVRLNNPVFNKGVIN